MTFKTFKQTNVRFILILLAVCYLNSNWIQIQEFKKYSEWVYTTTFSTKNGKPFTCFGHSFTRQLHFMGLKMQTFENDTVAISVLTKNAKFIKFVHIMCI